MLNASKVRVKTCHHAEVLAVFLTTFFVWQKTGKYKRISIHHI